MAKHKAKRKDKTIPTLDDVVLKKTQEEKTAPVETETTKQEDTTKAEQPKPEDITDEIPAKAKQDAEIPPEEDPKNKNQQDETESDLADTGTKEPETSRRVGDRRVKDVPLHSGESDRRVSQRRQPGSRISDRAINAQLDPLIEKILHEMIPDISEHIETKLGVEIKSIVSNIMPELEQHMRMQLRFEIDKHMSKILRSGIQSEDE